MYTGRNVNVFVQKNIHHTLNYDKKSMKNYLFWDKSILFLSFVPNLAYLFNHLFFNVFGSFKIGVAYKRLAYKKRANSNLIAHRNNTFSCKQNCEAFFRIICVKNYLDNLYLKENAKIAYCSSKNMSYRIEVLEDTKCQNLISFFEKRWISKTKSIHLHCLGHALDN